MTIANAGSCCHWPSTNVVAVSLNVHDCLSSLCVRGAQTMLIRCACARSAQRNALVREADVSRRAKLDRRRAVVQRRRHDLPIRLHLGRRSAVTLARSLTRAARARAHLAAAGDDDRRDHARHRRRLEHRKHLKHGARRRAGDCVAVCAHAASARSGVRGGEPTDGPAAAATATSESERRASIFFFFLGVWW